APVCCAIVSSRFTPGSLFPVVFIVTSTTENDTLPYTTLFRSGGEGGQNKAANKLRGLGMGLRTAATKRRGSPAITAQPLRDSPVDRKSTRLNSSHVKTSYAVFRLKKNRSSLDRLWRSWNAKHP